MYTDEMAQRQEKKKAVITIFSTRNNALDQTQTVLPGASCI